MLDRGDKFPALIRSVVSFKSSLSKSRTGPDASELSISIFKYFLPPPKDSDFASL